MPIITVFYIKLFLSALLTATIFWTLWKADYFEKWQKKNDLTVYLLGVTLLRILPWIGIFVILNFEPRGDVPFFFYKAEHAKLGGFVYRDFWSYHAPLFSYIISLPLWLWHNPRIIVLLMIVVESIIVWFTYKSYKPIKSNALQLAFVYLLLPATFMYIAIDGQEEIWFWGVGIGMLSYLNKKRENYEVGLGLLFTLALITLKATFVFLLPALLIVVKRPLRMLFTMAAVGLPVVGFMYYQIGDLFLMPIRHTEQLMTPNLFSILRPIIELFIEINSQNSTLVNWVGLFFTLLVPCGAALKARNRPINETFPGLFILTFCSMMIFQASAPGAYVISFLVIVVFQLVDVDNWSDVLIVVALGWLTVVQPFVNVYLGQPEYTSFLFFKEPRYLFDIFLQIANVLCFVWIVVKAWNDVVKIKTITTA